MEPTTSNSHELLPILEELKQLEPLLYAANGGLTREHFEKLLVPDFWEVGASGRCYSREFVLSVLDERQRHPIEEPWQTSDHQVRKIAEHNYLLTYTLHQATRTSRRASVWRRTDTGWQMLYHQGTVVAPSQSADLPTS
jgi:hypothetical protein